MSNSSGGDHAKKRRVRDGSIAAFPSERLEHGDVFTQQLMSTMNQLLDHSHAQLKSMASMQKEMQGMKEEIKSVKMEMTKLRDTGDEVKKSLLETQSQSESRFNDVAVKQKYHGVLLKNQKWEYPDEDLPSFGFEQPQERSLVADIREATLGMRYGTNNGEIQILNFDGGDFIEGIVPHWEEFSKALDEYQHALRCLPEDVSSSFALTGVQLPPCVLDLLSNALKSNNFKKFELQGNSMIQDGIPFVLNYMQSNPELEELCLSENRLFTKDEINQLCDIIQKHPSIRLIQLDDCCENEVNGHDALCAIITAGASKLKILGFSSNATRTNGSTFISDFLQTNPILEELVLTGDNLDDRDASWIAKALGYNTNLMYLWVEDNNMTDAGWNMLLQAEFDPTSLSSAANSNHTCFIENHSKFNAVLDELCPPSVVRQMKIYSLLSLRNNTCSNVQHFDDIPVKLLPDMLSSIQKYSKYHCKEDSPEQNEFDAHALSVVFEVMRRWDKSLSAYEALSNLPNSRGKCRD